MSDGGALTVPVAGWYPDRSESNIVRWWDGQQWTDQTQSIAPAAAAFEQPVSSAAFGFVPVEPNPVAQNPVVQNAVVQSSGVAPGWYPDNRDPSLQRWWDGRDWTAHTTPTVTTPASPISATVNSLATRGMIYSLIGLVLNPFAMMSIGGFVLGVRALHRAPQFAPASARRGPAIAAIVLGVIGSVATVLLIIVAITTAVSAAQRNGVHVFDRAGAERHLVAELGSTDSDTAAVSVSCPPDSAMRAGDTFDCTATLADGQTMPIHITIEVNSGLYTYSWKADLGEASGASDNGSELYQADHAGTGSPYTLPIIEQNTAADFLGHYGVAVTKDICDSDASVAPGDFFECTVTLADGRTAGVQIAMNDADGGYNMLVIYPPAGGSVTTDPAPPTDGDDADNPDLSHS